MRILIHSPIIQRGGIILVKLTSSSKEATSSIHLDDIPENNPLYAQLRTYLSQKQSDTFALVAKEEVDDIRSYERVVKKEMIFLIENSEIREKRRRKIFGRYLLSELYLGESYKNPALRDHFSEYGSVEFHTSRIISIEDWGISSMKESGRPHKISTNFTCGIILTLSESPLL
ncbi:hypothetical protein H5410_017060 [Solanum commersonii]|uniref:Uncharacterized protein n=1 Tax=Solanum commersonii TaxID=4109 RepID=A0A9J5ZZ77_SOLCO|nr:hypothetical protein H5410_017060 [Solanum commersonii]